MRTIIHVNRQVIDANRKSGAAEPPLSVRNWRETRRATEAVIHAPDGTVVARVVYRPDRPLSCGAKVWIETDLPVEVR